MTADGVLVSWISVGAREAPLMSALSHERSLLFGRIGTVVLCYRDGSQGDPKADLERTVLAQTRRALRDGLKPMAPRVEVRPWKTDAAPTDHAAIRPFAEEVLLSVRKQRPDAPIYIHVSPGTPAMHAVWLVLASTGVVSDPVHLVQGVSDRDREPGDPPVVRVEFPLDTWLRRYRRQRPSRPSTEDDGYLWDPRTAKSAALKETLADLQRYAPLRVPVLLVGERGTGKTTLAGQLRAMSPFQGDGGDTWPVVVCGQFKVNPELARSELFGHAKGAFTGATTDREGLLERASGDTILLDEIGDIDRDTQRLLVAAVEGRGFTRLGDSTVRKGRFRLVCATNRRLGELRGEILDEDFYDRIAMFVVRVPPLRECREDLPDLWRSVLMRSQRTAEVEPEAWWQMAEDAGLLKGLAAHPLPGNLRDLQRVAFHLLAAIEGGLGGKEAVAIALRALDRRGAPPVPVDLRGRLPLGDGGLSAELRRTETAWLEAALAAADGKKSQAAKLLGMKRKTYSDRLARCQAGE